tara:strand:+ start:1379 stop:1564 length:186 start_codon:yes stop_codon:yes gene_type:complete
MEIQISVGEWMNTLQSRMESAVEGDCFHLPTQMHHHAFTLLSKEVFPNKKFDVIVDANNQQ